MWCDGVTQHCHECDGSVDIHSFLSSVAFSVTEVSMEDFPWEILKVQTLQHLSQELGLARGLEKDEAVGFLKAVQRKGCMCLLFSFALQAMFKDSSRVFLACVKQQLKVGPALAEEITKDFATGGSDQIQQNGNVKSPPVPTSNTRGRTVPSAPSRRISTRKRPAPESDFEQDARTEDEDTQEESDDEGKKRQGAKEQEPKSVSAVTRNLRSKRPRVSDPGPPPARGTRSHGPALSVSIVTDSRKNHGRTLRRTQTDAHLKGSAVSAVSLSEKRSTRRSTKLQASNADDGTDADADGEDEVTDEGEGAGRSIGPNAIVAALKKANKETPNTNNRGRTSKLVSASLRPRKDEPTNAATTVKSKSRPVTASQVHVADANKSISAHDLQTTKRTIRPTARGALLVQKQRTSILSRPVRPEIQQRLQTQKAKSDHSKKDNEKPKRYKEVFDGVVLEKRCIVIADVDAINGNTEGDLVRQSDEFVANGLAGQSESAESTMDMDRDLVLEREDISSLGGSGKGKLCFPDDSFQAAEYPCRE